MTYQRESVHEVGTSVELFAGGGGLAMAVHAAGFRHLLLNEFAMRACQTLTANQAAPIPHEGYIPQRSDDPWPLVEGPVQGLDFRYLNGQVTLLAGGPPCQPFSLGGEHRGHEDERNMFPEFFRALREMGPLAFICENVRGLLRPSFKPYFDYIINELRMPFVERGDSDWQQHSKTLSEEWLTTPATDEERRKRYVVLPTPVNAADYGVPQVRHRVIIVGFRMDLGIGEDLWVDKFMPRRTHSEASLMRHLGNPRSDYWKRHQTVPAAVRRQVIEAAPVVEDNEDTTLLPWRTLRDAIMGDPDQREQPLPQTGLIDYQEHPQSPTPNHIGWPGARIYDGHTPNVLDRPAKTVKAGVHGVPGGESVVLLDSGDHRYMTVRETARVMTFPDSWKPAGPRGEQMRQLGNAVPVLLGKKFAEAVAEALSYASDHLAGNPAENNEKVTAGWKGAAPPARAWKRTRGTSSACEQDTAAGGHDQRVVPLDAGRIALGSVALRVFPKSRRIRAYLRWSDRGRTREKYLGEVDAATRLENLQQAWILARDQGAALPDGSILEAAARSSWASSVDVRAAMRGNRSKDTKPELRLRKELYAIGLRYRVSTRPLPGIRRSADIVFTRPRVAVFVDGCYWHGCPQHYRPSTRNTEFWSEKIDANRRRDSEANQLLGQAGWHVIRVWEHEDPAVAARRIAELVSATALRNRATTPSAMSAP